MLLLSALLAGCMEEPKLHIIPQPAEMKASSGHFEVTAQTPLVVESGSRNPAERLVEELLPYWGVAMPIAEQGQGILLRVDESIGHKEGYKLEVGRKGILLTGGSDAGLYYGLQSLRQLIIAHNGKIPCGEIADQPHFAYRGAHLDVCRHFFTVEEVKRYIDILAAHKLNRFHWHLTDDQGWRIEIKAFPELTEKGAMRKQTVIGHCHDPKGYDGIPHGGYYTQEEIRDVVEYAAARYITIIPEIEMPGHAQAALHALPQLGCREQQVEVWGMWGVTPEVMCAGKESTYDFLEQVLTEVVELFPGELIHIGGDECPKDRWKECPHCQGRMRELGLENESQLQGYLVARIEKFLNGYGRHIIGWDDILEGGVTPTATVMSWQGSKGGIYAAKQGNNAIMAPMEYCYFDFYQTESREGEGLGIGGWVSFDKVYGWDPYEGLNTEERKHIIGMQCNLWSEYITTADHLYRMLLPRLAALCEVQWAYDRRDPATVRERMETQRRFYEANNWPYAPYYFEGRL